MQTTVATLITGILIAASAWAAQTAEERVERTEDASGLNRVAVSELTGAVSVTGRDNASAITIHALKRASAPDESTAREILAATEIVIRRNGATLEIEARRPDLRGREENRWTGRTWVSVDYRIEVPSSFTADILTSSGDVEAAGVRIASTRSVSGSATMRNCYDAAARTSSGDVELRSARIAMATTVNGDVRMLDCDSMTVESSSGEVEVRAGRALAARTVSGDISVDAAEMVHLRSSSGEFAVGSARNARMETVSGDVRLGTGTTVSVRTSSGDMVMGSLTRADVRSVSGSISVVSAAALRANTSSGRVRAGLSGGVESVQVETVSGDVDLGLPLGADYRVSATTLSGRLRTGGLTLSDLEFSRQGIRGRVGAGTVPLKVSTSSGNITFVTR